MMITPPTDLILCAICFVHVIYVKHITNHGSPETVFENVSGPARPKTRSGSPGPYKQDIR